MRGKPPEYRKALGEIVYQAMIDVINVPKDDKFKVITEHAPEELNFSASYLGNHYSQDVVFIQIALNAGRSREAQRARANGTAQAHLRPPAGAAEFPF
jgi:4-oxalocrotonate tautomerase